VSTRSYKKIIEVENILVNIFTKKLLTKLGFINNHVKTRVSTRSYKKIIEVENILVNIFSELHYMQQLLH
jgi:hypothetical protein